MQRNTGIFIIIKVHPTLIGSYIWWGPHCLVLGGSRGGGGGGGGILKRDVSIFANCIIGHAQDGRSESVERRGR